MDRPQPVVTVVYQARIKLQVDHQQPVDQQITQHQAQLRQHLDIEGYTGEVTVWHDQLQMVFTYHAQSALEAEEVWQCLRRLRINPEGLIVSPKPVE